MRRENRERFFAALITMSMLIAASAAQSSHKNAIQENGVPRCGGHGMPCRYEPNCEPGVAASGSG
jgi:hypothetical protein